VALRRELAQQLWQLLWQVVNYLSHKVWLLVLLKARRQLQCPHRCSPSRSEPAGSCRMHNPGATSSYRWGCPPLAMHVRGSQPTSTTSRQCNSLRGRTCAFNCHATLGTLLCGCDGRGMDALSEEERRPRVVSSGWRSSVWACAALASHDCNHCDCPPFCSRAHDFQRGDLLPARSSCSWRFT